MTKKLLCLSNDAIQNIKSNLGVVWNYRKENPGSFDWAYDFLGKDFLKESEYSLDLSFNVDGYQSPKDSDFDNTILLYENLKSIPRNVVLSEQFLAGLFFTYGYSYFQWRWMNTLKDDPKTGISHILFLTNPRRSLAVNAFGRLILRGFNLIEEGKQDKYDLLKKAYKYPAVLMIEYYLYADNPKVYKAFVKSVVDYSESNSPLNEDEIRTLARHLSMIQGVSLGEELSEEELEGLLTEYIPNCLKGAQQN